jgi:hypothetical protein
MLDSSIISMRAKNRFLELTVNYLLFLALHHQDRPKKMIEEAITFI